MSDLLLVKTDYAKQPHSENNEPLAIKQFSWIPNQILQMIGVSTEVRYEQVVELCGPAILTLMIQDDRRADRYGVYFTASLCFNAVYIKRCRSRRGRMGRQTSPYHEVSRRKVDKRGFVTDWSEKHVCSVLITSALVD